MRLVSSSCIALALAAACGPRTIDPVASAAASADPTTDGASRGTPRPELDRAPAMP
jgi:hypothetical protein